MGYQDMPECAHLIEWRTETDEGDLCACGKVFGGPEILPEPDEDDQSATTGPLLNGGEVWRMCRVHRNCLNYTPCPGCFEADHPGFSGALPTMLQPCYVHRKWGDG